MKPWGGLRPGELIVIGRRPGIGKTSFAMNIAEYVAIKQQKNVLAFNLESCAESAAMKLISSVARIEVTALSVGKLDGEGWERFINAISLLAEAKLHLNDTPNLTCHQLCEFAHQWKEETGAADLIVVDYLQLMQGSKEYLGNRTNEIS